MADQLNLGPYSLQDIVRLQSEGLVTLPTVQRGFVWRPYQIENLWDSLLRGYPVGAFVLSLRAKGKGFELLDGQQRATAICLGLGAKTFRGSEAHYRLFVDLMPPKLEDNRKYLFRVVSRSHPWGYQKSDNARTLPVDSIRNALALYGVADYLREPTLDAFFPYDAVLPVPFSLFVSSEGTVQAEQSILYAIERLSYWPKLLNLRSPDYPSPDLANHVTEGVRRIREACIQLLDPEHGARIPALLLDFDRISRSASNEPDEAPNESSIESNEEQLDEVENLFVRLNSGGTPLQGEELNYSILKSHIKAELQADIEKACRGLVAPARFVTIAYRLYQHSENKNGIDSILLRVKPKQFQRAMTKDQKDRKAKERSFQDFLAELVRPQGADNLTFLGRIKLLLAYNTTNCPFGFPTPIVMNLGTSAPEILFLLMYRILIKHDNIKLGSDFHRRVLGMVSLLSWFGRGNRQRNHAAVLRNVWPCALELGVNEFWSPITVARGRIGGILIDVPHLDEETTETIFGEIMRPEPKADLWARLQSREDGTYAFLETALYERFMVMYAQRTFLAMMFTEEHFLLEDSSIPFDWDHISPHSFVNRIRNISRPLQDLYATNGNFRAWPYQLNRMDQDTSPGRKLNPLAESDPSIKEFWREFIRTNPELSVSEKTLTTNLLKWSFCDEQWLKLQHWDLKQDKGDPTYACIIERNIRILKHWQTELRLAELIPSQKELNPFTIMNAEYWEEVTSDKHWAWALYDPGEQKYYVTKKPVLAKSNLHFYLLVPDWEAGMLQSEKFQIGIVDASDSGFFSLTELPSLERWPHETDKHRWLWRNFTLLSIDRGSVTNLIGNIGNWLTSSPVAAIRALAAPWRNASADVQRVGKS